MSEIATPMKDVEGKIAFITGGSSGIGLGIARACVNAGMKVVITYRTRAHLDRAMQYFAAALDRVHSIDVDVTDRPGMARAAEETLRVFGKVHVLVNNAAAGIIVPLEKATYDDWDWGVGVNVTGVFNGVREFLPRIRAHGEGGHIVTTSSMGGLTVARTAGVYATTKFAVVGMMEALRTELLDTNIGVSVYCPAAVNTDIQHSDRNRPRELSDTGFKPDPHALAAMQARRAQHPDPAGGPGMDSLEAGERVLRGIRNNDLYILSHPEFEQTIRDRSEALLASLPFGEPPVPQARLDHERELLRPPMYVMERDRKLTERAQGRQPFTPSEPKKR
jgi:NAD(P)-dependent dehydrogenase (short-subunit alcohol dehydrogenase family)